ncbi:hypothetical protein TOPH_08890 [Tolypocladium ophioglossoides CBS 100239]|uniref:Uncharacterized protein n=1 Tax=Tolypocladium ophioglossoides (strain CBS 100239) TaxID=1163406 RepID=A0A0L0MYD8_TOLOC|nr:hypothetical protein TOPH_08890 [Tolypocladium ophioglossoides CBS 100239]
MSASKSIFLFQQFRQVQDCVTQCSRALHAIKSPDAEHEEKLAHVKARLKEAWQHIYACQNSVARPDIEDKIVGYGRELEKLEISHKAGLEDAETTFHHRTEAVLKRLCEELITALGPSLVEESLRSLSGADQHLPDGSINNSQGMAREELAQSATHRGFASDRGITEKTANKVSRSKAWSAVLLLPTENLKHVGVPDTIESLGLADDVPQCYDYNPQKKIFQWREEYKDGACLVSQREYPVMYFDGLDFPSKSAVGWVAAKDLRNFDAKDTKIRKLIEHSGQVRKFLKERERTRSEEPRTGAGAESGEAALASGEGVRGLQPATPTKDCDDPEDSWPDAIRQSTSERHSDMTTGGVQAPRWTGHPPSRCHDTVTIGSSFNGHYVDSHPPVNAQAVATSSNPTPEANLAPRAEGQDHIATGPSKKPFVNGAELARVAETGLGIVQTITLEGRPPSRSEEAPARQSPRPTSPWRTQASSALYRQKENGQFPDSELLPIRDGTSHEQPGNATWRSAPRNGAASDRNLGHARSVERPGGPHRDSTSSSLRVLHPIPHAPLDVSGGPQAICNVRLPSIRSSFRQAASPHPILPRPSAASTSSVNGPNQASLFDSTPFRAERTWPGDPVFHTACVAIPSTPEAAHPRDRSSHGPAYAATSTSRLLNNSVEYRYSG